VKRLAWIVGCALAIAAGSRAPASAQADPELAANWDLRAGFFIPEREVSRRAEGDLWFTIGAEKAVYVTDRWKGTISVDYYGSGRTYNIPIALNIRGESQRLRYGAGAGVGISHDLSEGQTGFHYNLLLGYALTEGVNPLTVDVRYMFLSTGHGQLNGWAFTLGYHY